MLASRASADSGENGDSGLVGSAAFLKNVPANSWYGAATATHEVSTPRSRAAKSDSRSSTSCAAARWSCCIWP